jgi:hypothetical protein
MLGIREVVGELQPEVDLFVGKLQLMSAQSEGA